MEFEFSNNKVHIERIKKLKNLRLIYRIIEFLLLIMVINFSLVTDFEFIPVLLVVLIISILVGIMYYFYIVHACNVTQESLFHELNPKLNIDYNIYLLNTIYKGTKPRKYVLSDIATGYLYDGDFEKCKEILDYLEKGKMDKLVKITVLEKKMMLNYFENKYKEALKVKEELLKELENANKKIKDQILFNIEMYTALIEKDKDKLTTILKTLKKSERNIDKVDYLYIKSQFFEEEDNKYQKKLAFEGGDIFYAREELEDQSITTKNNIKPNKHKGFKNISIILLIISIIATMVSFIAYFL